MSDFKSRLVEEQEQLEERLNKLNEFNQSEKVNAIDPVHKSILIIQARAMQTYNESNYGYIGREQNFYIQPSRMYFMQIR